MATPITYCAIIDVLDLSANIRIYNGRVNHGAVTGGPFVVGEIITGGTSSATGTIDTVTVDHIDYTPTLGSFEELETVTGGTSSATISIDSLNPKTQPDVAGAERIMVDISAEMDGYMRGGGITIPLVTDVENLAFLNTFAVLGSACRISHAAMQGTEVNQRVKKWCDDYARFLKDIRTGGIKMPVGPVEGVGSFFLKAVG